MLNADCMTVSADEPGGRDGDDDSRGGDIYSAHSLRTVTIIQKEVRNFHLIYI